MVQYNKYFHSIRTVLGTYSRDDLKTNALCWLYANTKPFYLRDLGNPWTLVYVAGVDARRHPGTTTPSNAQRAMVLSRDSACLVPRFPISHLRFYFICYQLSSISMEEPSFSPNMPKMELSPL